MVLVSLVFAFYDLQQPAWRSRHLSADLGGIDDLQLQPAKANAVARANLIALTNLFFVDESTVRCTEVRQVIEAIVVAQLSVKRCNADVV